MERKQLIKLIENKGTSSKEETAELWDIVRTYPYFQTARLLLVKSFHKQGSVHFHNELKTAAAYAPDRKVLFHLINDEETTFARSNPSFGGQKADEENNVFAIEQKQPVEDAPVFEIKEAAPTFVENRIETIAPEIKYTEAPPEKIIEEKKSISPPPLSSLDEPATTNEEIIRRRLSEILSKGKPEQQAEQQLAVDNLQIPQVRDELPTSPEEPVAHSILDALPSEPVDEIEGLEIETIIEENYLQELEKLPEIIKPVAKAEPVVSKPIATEPKELSFIDWLKQKNAEETTLEEVLDEPVHFHHEIGKRVEKPAIQSADLINKFIETKPRIAPVKAEFYSPSNMARQSITDNEDIISETLARIYFDQQNYPKARACYERLTLLYPEKSAFFAPLIQKIDDIIKNQI